MDNNLVFDIGMHKAEDTAYYLRQGCRVVAVEANPVLAGQGSDRFKAEIAAGKLVIENVGISDEPGAAEFWVCEEKSEWSSFNRPFASRRGYHHHSIEVQCVRLPNLIQKHGMPFYMKIDIEGNDAVCLRQMSAPQTPAYVSVEAYGEESVRDLMNLGYTQFKVIDQISFCTLEHPPTAAYAAYWSLKRFWEKSLHDKTAYGSRFFGKIGGRFLAEGVMGRYRRRGGFEFVAGSSGPFGESTSGRWRSGEVAMDAIRRFEQWHATTGESPEKRWFDVHAKK